MLQLETQSQPSPMSQPTTTAILVIGGAEDKVHG
ncbi:MAG: cyanophycinase, partial [Crocosphaera sp.]|nr:cyanophycinase [Crocosphaera sp.]